MTTNPLRETITDWLVFTNGTGDRFRTVIPAEVIDQARAGCPVPCLSVEPKIGVVVVKTDKLNMGDARA